MQRYLGSCSPGQVQMLQNICDAVNATALLRDIITRRVLSHFYDQTFNMETAAEAVLLSFSTGRGEGMVAPVSKEVERALVPPENEIH